MIGVLSIGDLVHAQRSRKNNSRSSSSKTISTAEPMPRTTWIFDLDNTLHNASRHAFPVINRAMNVYLAAQLELSIEEASALRMGYWRRYGATLSG